MGYDSTSICRNGPRTKAWAREATTQKCKHEAKEILERIVFDCAVQLAGIYDTWFAMTGHAPAPVAA
jgi:hypothetical protein